MNIASKLLALFVSAVVIGVGNFVFYLCLDQGPQQCVWLALIIAAFFSGLNACIAWLWFSLEVYNPTKQVTVYWLCSVFISLVASGLIATGTSQHAADERKISAEVSQYALTHFDELDADHDNNIVADEILSAQAKFIKGGTNATLLGELALRIQDIGHVVHIRSGTKSYELDRADLAAYPSYVVKKWSRWPDPPSAGVTHVTLPAGSHDVACEVVSAEGGVTVC